MHFEMYCGIGYWTLYFKTTQFGNNVRDRKMGQHANECSFSRDEMQYKVVTQSTQFYTVNYDYPTVLLLLPATYGIAPVTISTV